MPHYASTGATKVSGRQRVEGGEGERGGTQAPAIPGCRSIPNVTGAWNPLLTPLLTVTTHAAHRLAFAPRVDHGRRQAIVLNDNGGGTRLHGPALGHRIPPNARGGGKLRRERRAQTRAREERGETITCSRHCGTQNPRRTEQFPTADAGSSGRVRRMRVRVGE